MPIAARFVVGFVFVVIGLSFLATTAALAYEFQGHDWFALASFYSHLFVFFPTYGLVALIAFSTPSCVFLDLYWRHLRFGKLRFLLGLAVIAGASVLAGQMLTSGKERSIWEVAPAVLEADRGEPADCGGAAAPCTRVPILEALDTVRLVSQKRIGLSDLARNCSADPLVESSPGAAPRRFCFVSTRLADGAPLTSDAECCRLQQHFAQSVREKYQEPGAVSLTGRLHTWLLPLKIFFLLQLAVIGILLAVRHHLLDEHYASLMPAVERGVLIGAIAMLFYPVMNHAFLQSAQLLYGEAHGSAYRWFAPWLSFVFGAWALLIFLFFFRQRNKELEQWGRFGSIAFTVVAILKYDLIIDYFVRIAGSGAGTVNMLLMVGAGLLALGFVHYLLSRDPATPISASGFVGLGKQLRDALDDATGKGN